MKAEASNLFQGRSLPDVETGELFRALYGPHPCEQIAVPPLAAGQRCAIANELRLRDFPVMLEDLASTPKAKNPPPPPPRKPAAYIAPGETWDSTRTPWDEVAIGGAA